MGKKETDWAIVYSPREDSLALTRKQKGHVHGYEAWDWESSDANLGEWGWSPKVEGYVFICWLEDKP